LLPYRPHTRGVYAVGSCPVSLWGHCATCSLEAEENEGVVFPFLEAHRERRLDPPESFSIPLDPPGVLRCLPPRHGTDGFTAFRLRKS
jgi:16S rRNA C967 or C1407 C5-methylase (RsmB/RsmF family)